MTDDPLTPQYDPDPPQHERTLPPAYEFDDGDYDPMYDLDDQPEPTWIHWHIVRPLKNRWWDIQIWWETRRACNRACKSCGKRGTCNFSDTCADCTPLPF